MKITIYTKVKINNYDELLKYIDGRCLTFLSQCIPYHLKTLVFQFIEKQFDDLILSEDSTNIDISDYFWYNRENMVKYIGYKNCYDLLINNKNIIKSLSKNDIIQILDESTKNYGEYYGHPELHPENYSKCIQEVLKW